MREESDKARLGRRLLGALVDELFVTGVLSALSLGTLGVAYFVAQDSIGGQSLGRRMARQELIDFETGDTVDPAQAAVRNLIGFITTSLILGALIDLVLVVVRDDGRRICDLLAGTQVVDLLEPDAVGLLEHQERRSLPA